MTKNDFKSRVKGLFSIRWLKNNGEEGYIHRGILDLITLTIAISLIWLLVYYSAINL